MILGIHAASIGGVLAPTAKADDTVCNRMYVKLRANPMPRYSPMPPLRFLDESERPMVVRMNEANDVAIRL